MPKKRPFEASKPGPFKVGPSPTSECKISKDPSIDSNVNIHQQRKFTYSCETRAQEGEGQLVSGRAGFNMRTVCLPEPVFIITRLLYFYDTLNGTKPVTKKIMWCDSFIYTYIYAYKYTDNSTLYRKDGHVHTYKKNAKTTDVHQSVNAVLTSEEGSGLNEGGIFLVFSEYKNSSLLRVFHSDSSPT